jgi:hypothetical protein
MHRLVGRSTGSDGTFGVVCSLDTDHDLGSGELGLCVLISDY